MLFDSDIVPQAIARPKSFAGLMALYESNYLRLLRLIPDLERIDGCLQSTVAGDCDLHVDIIERCPYTLTLSLTYRFETDDGIVDDPDILVRIYLDGQQAEAMRIGEHRRHEALRALVKMHGDELGLRWRRNVILNKWLDYLSEQGHLILDR